MINNVTHQMETDGARDPEYKRALPLKTKEKLPFSPLKLYLIISLSWVIFFIISIFMMKYEVQWTFRAIALLTACFLSFPFGFWTWTTLRKHIKARSVSFGSTTRTKRSVLTSKRDSDSTHLSTSVANPKLFTSIKVKSYSDLAHISYALGIVGLLLRVYIKAKAVGSSLTLNPIAIRAALLNEGASTGPIDIIAAALFPFSLFYFAAIHHAASYGYKISYVQWALMIALISFDSVLNGGTTGLALNYAFIWFCSRQAYKAVSLRLIALCAAILFASGYIFYLRILEMVPTATIYLQMKDGVWLFTIPQLTYDLTAENGLLGYATFLTFYLSYYFSHGVVEFVHLVNLFDMSNLTWGQLQLNVISKFMNAFGFNFRPYMDIQEDINIIIGHYQTFWGNAFMDFGYLAPLEGFLLGIVCATIYKAKNSSSFLGVFCYPFAQSLIIYSIFANGLSGERFYIIFMLPVAWSVYLFTLSVNRQAALRRTKL